MTLHSTLCPILYCVSVYLYSPESFIPIFYTLPSGSLWLCLSFLFYSTYIFLSLSLSNLFVSPLSLSPIRPTHPSHQHLLYCTQERDRRGFPWEITIYNFNIKIRYANILVCVYIFLPRKYISKNILPHTQRKHENCVG